MTNDPLSNEGFTLVELLVTVSILGVMGAGVMIGFNTFGDSVKAKEAMGVLEDLIRESEAAVLKKDYEKVVFHFREDYVILEEFLPAASLDLNLGVCTGGGDPAVLSLQGSTLQKTDEAGQSMGVERVGAGESTCVTNFEDASQQEWRYQLKEGDDTSSAIRFAHFNLNTSFQLKTSSGGSPSAYTLEILGPYGSKTLSPPGPLELKLFSNGEPTETTLNLSS